MPTSGQPEADDADTEPDVPTEIPPLVGEWLLGPKVSAVRRPSRFPDPQSYHEMIEPAAIFELDEEQRDGSVETILVVASCCTRCRLLKQACSRTQPTCARCQRVGASCVVTRKGYHRLPGPKCKKPSSRKKRGMSETSDRSMVSSASSCTPQAKPIAARSRLGRKASRISKAAPSGSASSIASGSKRGLSPGPDPAPPRKRALTKATSRFGRKARCHTVVDSRDMDVDTMECSRAPSVGERGVLEWTFVKGARERDEPSSKEQGHAHSMPSDARIPRVWTNSLAGLLTVFPQLVRAPVGLSWFQSDTPILLLDTNYAQGHWINSTTLTIDLLWDFSCEDSELEPVVESNAEFPTQPHSSQSVMRSPENTFHSEVDKMDQRYSPPRIGLFPTHATVSIPLLSSSLLSSDGTAPPEQHICQSTNEDHFEASNPIHDATRNDWVLATSSPELLYPSSPLPPVDDLPLLDVHSALDGPLTNTFQTDTQPRIPLNKPPEVETLLNSHLRFIPLLLWMPDHSELVPCNLSPEYAYSCMGLFFISDLRHAAIQHGVPSPAGLVQGRVCWSITLQWAPGGEDALFDSDPTSSSDTTLDLAPSDNPRDLLRPWWVDPTDTLPQVDNANPHHSRTSRAHSFSFIPLDLLADFHPSESFPRGWFCKSCGMVNIQEFFRHQICRSTLCGTLRKEYIPQGKVDSLSSLRDPYQSSTQTRPADNIPPAVNSDHVTWDDGMQSWIYDIKDGVRLWHIFTGNQRHLQEDATTLLERIQREVLLRRDDPSGPYFTQTTSLLHPSDGSGATVPGGTPDCVRLAYYTLCDFVPRYAEMDAPRFGTVCMQSWVNPGSRRGSVFRASKSPVVIHCLGVEVILNLIPKGGYKEAAESTLTAVAKGKGKERARDECRAKSPPAEPIAGPSRQREHDNGDQPSFISAPEANESPIVAKQVDEAMATMATTLQCLSSGAGGVAKPNSNAPHVGSGTEVAHHEVAEPNQAHGRKKNKGTKGKNKASVPEISMTLLHGDCVVLYGDDFKCQIVRVGTTILVTGHPEENSDVTLEPIVERSDYLTLVESNSRLRGP